MPVYFIAENEYEDHESLRVKIGRNRNIRARLRAFRRPVEGVTDDKIKIRVSTGTQGDHVIRDLRDSWFLCGHN